MKKREAINFLQSAPIEELVEVFQAVFKERIPVPEEAAFNKTRFCLAVTSRQKMEGTDQWMPTEIELVAYPDTNDGPDWGLCQYGSCSVCGVTVCSNSKNGDCPACSSKAYMT